MYDSNTDLTMYFDKLIKVIENDSDFSFGNTKIVNKQRIDDILCCIDANFPDILKRYKKANYKDNKVKSFEMHKQLMTEIKVKPFFGGKFYVINYSTTVELVANLRRTLNTDIAYIQKTYPNL